MRFLCLLSILLFPFFGLGQSLADLESEIAALQLTVGTANTDEERFRASDEIKSLFKECFKESGVFEYPFENLHKVSSLKSPDEKFRFINWSIPLVDGTYRYECFIIFPDGRNLVEFEDASDIEPGVSKSKLNPDEWYGALYYYIHPVVKSKKTYYLLLGWDGASELTSKKLIDVLEISKKGKATLGLPVLEYDSERVTRRVFEYSDEVVMTLRYMNPKHALVFDNLEPTEPGLKGQYAFYGPSNSHDAYRLNKEGEWDLLESFDMSRPASEDSGLPFNFPKRPDLDRIRK